MGASPVQRVKARVYLYMPEKQPAGARTAPWLQLTPDPQYIQSGGPSVDDAVVLAFRVQTDF